MKKIFTNIHDFVWDKLFLDFYLDKRFTFRFKLMNLISGDTLRPTIALMWANLKDLSRDNNNDLVISASPYTETDHNGVRSLVSLKVMHAKRELNDLMDFYRKGSSS